jgi:hypothetical protein
LRGRAAGPTAVVGPGRLRRGRGAEEVVRVVVEGAVRPEQVRAISAGDGFQFLEGQAQVVGDVRVRLLGAGRLAGAVAVQAGASAEQGLVGALPQPVVRGAQVAAGAEQGLGERLLDHLAAGAGAEAGVDGAVVLDGPA